MSVLKEDGLKKLIKENNISGAIMIYGDEGFLKEHYLKTIISKTVAGGQSEFNVVQLDFKEIEFVELYENIEGIPILAEKKCVVLKNLEPDKLTTDEMKRLAEIVADIPQYTVFVLYIDNVDFNLKKSSKCKKLLKLFEDNGLAADISKRTKTSLIKLLCGKAEKNGGTISKENASYLIEVLGDDLRALENELDKLLLMTDGAEITKEVIDNTVPKTLERSIFDLSKALIKHDIDSALMITNSLLIQKEEPVAIVAVLAGAFIDLYRARVMLNGGGSRTEVSKTYQYFGLEFRLKNAERDSSNMSMKYLRTCLELLTDCDSRLKSSPSDKNIILEEFIVKLGMVDR